MKLLASRGRWRRIAASGRFDPSVELRTCRTSGHVQSEKPPIPQTPPLTRRP